MKSQQRKGRAGEKELCEVLNSYGVNADVGKPLSFGTEPDLVGMEGIHIECKRNERLNVQEAMNQSIRDAEKFCDGLPAVFHRRNRCPWLVTMRLSDWINLYHAWNKYK